MKHLILCPEYPPAPIPPGGIGTYVRHIAALMAESGETVHVIGPLSEEAPKAVEEYIHGKLIVHRIGRDQPLALPGLDAEGEKKAMEVLLQSDFPRQWFAWKAGLLAEHLVGEAGIEVIEAQEYDAPLYFFQLRRALGMGPARRPPCIVHLHSPTELVFRHNEYDTWRPDYLTPKRLEDFSIASADAWLCPSRFLASEAESHYGLPKGSVNVIRLPIGDSPPLERREEVWRSGTICYIGRLEPRKGVIEWVDAAVRVAAEDANAVFEFLGSDLPYTETMTVQQHVVKRIPEGMKGRFRFRGSQPREKLSGYLKEARMAVVPSRWENFPNTCVEAMCSGLPVIASPTGGMAEMIRDGETGWIADAAGIDGLAAALRRALSTKAERAAEMGRQASLEIRQLCDNKKIVEDHRAFRGRVARDGPRRSLRLPVNLPWSGTPLTREADRPLATVGSPKEMAVVVNGLGRKENLEECLEGIERQIRPPCRVVLVCELPGPEGPTTAVQRARRLGWEVCEKTGRSESDAKNSGMEAVLSSGMDPIGFVFLEAADRIHPGFIEICVSVLERCPEVGLVSCWTDVSGGGRAMAHPCPAFPYQILSDETVPSTAIRTQALRGVGGFRTGLDSGFERWDLANAVMASGWTAVTVPALMAVRIDSESVPGQTAVPTRGGRMRSMVLARYPEVVTRYSNDLIRLLELRIVLAEIRAHQAEARIHNAAKIVGPDDIFRLTFFQQLARMGQAVRRPRRAFRFVVRQARRVLNPLWFRIRGAVTGRER